MSRRKSKNITKRENPVAKDIDEKGPKVEFSGSFISEMHYSGPIPPPDVLKDYGTIDATLPDRIMSMAEKEQNHMHETEKAQLNNDYILSRRGQNFAMTLTVIITVASMYFMYMGSSVGGAIFSSGVLVIIIHSFIRGHRTKKTPKNNPTL